MKKPHFLSVMVIPLLSSIAMAQISTEEATARMQAKARARAAATSQPSTMPIVVPYVMAPDTGRGPGFRDVVIVCDASGGMMLEFDNLRLELRKAVEALEPPQRFNIILFQQDGLPPLTKELLPANPENKRKMYDYIDKFVPRGDEPDLEPTIEAAFAMRPQLIYFFCSSSGLSHPERLPEIFHKLNQDGKVRVNTIAFMQGADYAKMQKLADGMSEGPKSLKQIASDSDGMFKIDTDADLAPEDTKAR